MKNKQMILSIYRKSTIKKIKNKMLKAGSNFKIDALEFLNIRIISTILIFCLIMFISNKGFILAPIISLIYFALYENIFLDLKINSRKKKLETEAIYFLEVLSLTIESGRNLKNALDITCDNVEGELSKEFKKTLEEVKLGKSMSEALESMKKRIPSDTINNTILNLKESFIYGNSVLKSLYDQIDYLRSQQILDVKAKISKLPTKISVISVLLFLPIVMLIIIAPIVIQYLMGWFYAKKIYDDWWRI